MDIQAIRFAAPFPPRAASDSAAPTDRVSLSGEPPPPHGLTPRDWKWLQERLRDGERPDEMAELMAMGLRFYDLKNRKQAELLEASLHGLAEFLDGKQAGGQLTRDERREALRILIPTLPPKPGWVMNHADLFRAFYDLPPILDDRKTQDVVYNFGYETRNLHFSPPPAEREKPFLQVLRDFVRYVDCMTHSDGRRTSEVKTNDDTGALHAIQIVRLHFHNDAAKEAELTALMPRVGDPWHALGIMEALEPVEPALRDEAKARVLRSIAECARERWKTAPAETAESVDMGLWQVPPESMRATTDGITLVYGLMQPGEEYEAARQGAERIAAALSAWNPGGGWLDARDVKRRLALVGRQREAGEPLDASFERFRAFCDTLAGTGATLDTAEKVYGTVCERRADIEAALMDGTRGRAGVTAAVAEMLGEGAYARRVPGELAPDLLKAALDGRQPGETLRDACGRVAMDYWLLEDFDGRGRLRAEVDAALARGELAGDAAELAAEVEQQVRMGRALGKAFAPALRDALRQVGRAHDESQARQATVERGEDYVLVGGVRIPVRRPGAG